MSVGSTCNDCEENNPENATLLRMRPDGNRREIVASGLRNTIGFAWQPGTGSLYGLDNGVDTFGDNEQPEELNRIEVGKKYGWPYILGDGMKHPLREPKTGTLEDWDKASVRPVLTYTAHAASMQLIFADRSGLPQDSAAMRLRRCTGRGIASRQAATRSCAFASGMASRTRSSPL